MMHIYTCNPIRRRNGLPQLQISSPIDRPICPYTLDTSQVSAILALQRTITTGANIAAALEGVVALTCVAASTARL